MGQRGCWASLRKQSDEKPSLVWIAAWSRQGGFNYQAPWEKVMNRQLSLEWLPNPQSVALAKLICLLRSDEPRAQYAGHDLWEVTWAANTLSGSFPAYCRHSTRKGYLLCSP